MAKQLWTTGFCSIGHCEGTRPRSRSGTAMKTCERILKDVRSGRTWSCACKCHADLDRMFEMMGMERFVDQNPDYKPILPTYIMPSLDERVALSMERRAVPTVIIESAAPEHVPATVTRVFTPTATGRAGRGQLELWVKQTCDQWVLDQPEESCTPQWISDQIAAKHEIKPPSVGAINAVFERWTKLNFALIGRKPVRFVGYTDDGVKHGLEGLKIRAKMQKTGSGSR